MQGKTNTADRLEYLRGELRAERISYAELAELQDLRDEIDPSDVELLEAAGVPEFTPDPEFDVILRPDDDAMVEYRWNESLIVNVYVGDQEVDVFTFAEQPTLADVKAACHRHLRGAAEEAE